MHGQLEVRWTLWHLLWKPQHKTTLHIGDFYAPMPAGIGKRCQSGKQALAESTAGRITSVCS